MNTLHVTALKTTAEETSPENMNEIIETSGGDYSSIECVNWPDEYPGKPIVHFKLLQIDKGIFLKFIVTEEFSSAIYTTDNDNVYTDSCVELFIDPSGDGSYYNFEFNAIGTLLLGFGRDRYTREQAPEKITRLVKRLPSLGFQPIETVRLDKPWELTVFIPFAAFWHHTISSLAGKTIKGNLQKCGDNLPTPHYTTWNPIKTPHPDYHRPEYFGTIQF
jgi:hypothetical protein